MKFCNKILKVVPYGQVIDKEEFLLYDCRNVTPLNRDRKIMLPGKLSIITSHW